MEDQILRFIKRFTYCKDGFLYGCCFWFAQILMDRFRSAAPVLYYDLVENHFAVMIDGKLYDASGEISITEDFMQWENVYQLDPLLYERVVNDSVLMIED